MKKKLTVLVLVALIAMGAQIAFGQQNEQSAPTAPPEAGVTKFDNGKGKIGPAIYIAHQDMWMLKAARDLEALIARIAVPKPYGSVVAQAIKIRTSFIQTKDRGNGVKLQWTHITWVPTVASLELFLASSQ